jgi:hypothetical protein
MVPHSRVIELKMSVDEAMKMIVTLGVVMPGMPAAGPAAAALHRGPSGSAIGAQADAPAAAAAVAAVATSAVVAASAAAAVAGAGAAPIAGPPGGRSG